MAGGRAMVLRLEVEKSEEGYVYCDWVDEESGDTVGDWFDPEGLQPYKPQ